MTDTTTPITPTNTNPQGATPPAQDLQINLDQSSETKNPETTPVAESQQTEGAKESSEIIGKNLPTSSENNPLTSDFNLDLNLPEAQTNDDRLKNEDQKNIEVEKTPVETPAEEVPTAQELTPEEVKEIPAVEELFAETPTIEENKVEEAPVETPTEEVPTAPELTPEEIKEIPVVETTPEINTTENTPGIEAPVETPAEEVPTAPELTPEEIKEIPVVETTPEINTTENTPGIEAPVETPAEDTFIQQPSTSIEEIPTTANKEIKENIIEPKTLQEDMNIIDQLAATASTGGLSPEVMTETKPTTTTETPKTFDLDAMLGTTPTITPTPIVTESPLDKGGNEGGFETQTTPVPTEQKTETPITPPEELIPTPAPAFTLPTPENQIPVQAVLQTNIPIKKNIGVKTFLFIVLFVALGFTSYFILQTMYPVEFGNIFSKGNDEQMHASEDITEVTTGIVEEAMTGNMEEITTGTMEEFSGEINDFGELNELGAEEILEEETDVSKLTNYINAGNEFVEIGKTLNNNTVIKYGMYISKKSTDFLGNIANGEEINNLSGYFAQFDKYLIQLEALVGTTNETTPSSPSEEITNETTDTMTQETTETDLTTNPLIAE